ncbi:MAG: lipocalin-like domain-containing protein [Halopseudomonas sp.]
MAKYLLLACCLLIGVGLVAVGMRDDSAAKPTHHASQLDIGQLLGGRDPVDPRFARADRVRPFDFPTDHQAHPEYRSEWWYLTGNVADSDNNPFAFQLTLFRQALRPIDGKPAANPWQIPQVYMGHLAIVDIANQRHRSVERFSRTGPGLAGSSAAPLRIWLEDWQLTATTDSSLFPLQLQAADKDQHIALNLTISSTKPKVLQGEAGLSRKSAEPGNASYYYSYPRLHITGQLSWDDKAHPVSGQAWYDHEWSSSILADYQTGWDWFSLQLDDGRELMLFWIRAKPGHPVTQHSVLIDRDGNKRPLDPNKIELTVLDHWNSPNGKRYPARWRLHIPSEGLDLDITPPVADQELRHSVAYWEGAVVIDGSHQGLGFVELVGY